MKTRYNIFFLIWGLLLFGCDDFLDVKPKGKDIPEKIAHYDGLFNNTILSNLIFSKVNENGSITAQQSEIYFIYMTDELITDEASYANMGRSAGRHTRMIRIYSWKKITVPSGVRPISRFIYTMLSPTV